MSRFTMATDLSSWREGQQSDRQARRDGGRRRKGRKGKKTRQGGGRQGPARGGGSELVEAVPRREAERGRGPGPGRGHGRDALRGEDDGPHEAELDDQELELEPDDLGEEAPPKRRKLKDRVQDAVTPDWQKPIDLGANLRIQTRPGVRAAVIEVKPGLFVVAEVPTESVEFGFGPMLLAPALIKTLGRALQGQRSAGGAGRAHRPELSTQPAPRQLPGPTADAPETSGLAPWLDGDIAAELGCPCELPKRRKP